jgi:ACT domain-containing protein
MVSLARLLFTIAKERGNILSITYRGECDIAAQQARVELELETREKTHADAIQKALAELGYEIMTG